MAALIWKDTFSESWHLLVQDSVGSSVAALIALLTKGCKFAARLSMIALSF
jgi:hypothetical protein